MWLLVSLFVCLCICVFVCVCVCSRVVSWRVAELGVASWHQVYSMPKIWCGKRFTLGQFHDIYISTQGLHPWWSQSRGWNIPEIALVMLLELFAIHVGLPYFLSFLLCGCVACCRAWCCFLASSLQRAKNVAWQKIYLGAIPWYLYQRKDCIHGDHKAGDEISQRLL